MSDQPRPEVLRHTASVVSAHLRRNQTAPEDLPQVIQAVYAALAGLDGKPAVIEAPRTPAVPVRRSVFPDYIICLEDGAKLKLLKRYIMTRFGLTPAAYRERWGLPSDYPMVAPAYTSTRSVLAKQLGLGRRRAAVTHAGDGGTRDNEVGPTRQDKTVASVAVTKMPARKAKGSKG